MKYVLLNLSIYAFLSCNANNSKELEFGDDQITYQNEYGYCKVDSTQKDIEVCFSSKQILTEYHFGVSHAIVFSTENKLLNEGQLDALKENILIVINQTSIEPEVIISIENSLLKGDFDIDAERVRLVTSTNSYSSIELELFEINQYFFGISVNYYEPL